jgi:hypothetical protein
MLARKNLIQHSQKIEPQQETNEFFGHAPDAHFDKYVSSVMLTPKD